MPTTIHPSYDPKAKVWFLDGSPIEAPTIPDLLAKMPKGTVVQDYYPLSAQPARIIIPLPAPVRPPPTPRVSSVIAVRNVGRPKRKHVSMHMLSQRPAKYSPGQYEKVLDLWATGMTGDKIAPIVGLPRVVVSSQIVATARARGDKRALTMTEKKEQRIKRASSSAALPGR